MRRKKPSEEWIRKMAALEASHIGTFTAGQAGALAALCQQQITDERKELPLSAAPAYNGKKEG